MKRLILICLLAPALFAQCVWKTIPNSRLRYQDCAGTASDAVTGASTLTTPGDIPQVSAVPGVLEVSRLNCALGVCTLNGAVKVESLETALIPEDANTVSHVLFTSTGIRDTQANAWDSPTALLAPPVYASGPPAMTAGVTRTNVGVFSDANYFTQGEAGAGLPDFAGAFTACFAFTPTNLTNGPVLFANWSGTSGSAGWLVQSAGASAGMYLIGQGFDGPLTLNKPVLGSVNIVCVGAGGAGATTGYVKLNGGTTVTKAYTYNPTTTAVATFGRYPLADNLSYNGTFDEMWFSTDAPSAAAFDTLYRRAISQPGAGYRFPDTSGTVLHLIGRDYADATWTAPQATLTTVGTVASAAVAATAPVPTKARRYGIRPAGGAGTLSTNSSFYSLPGATNVLDFSGDFSACIVSVPTAVDISGTSIYTSSGTSEGTPGWQLVNETGETMFLGTANSVTDVTATADQLNVICFGKSGANLVLKVNDRPMKSAGGTITAGVSDEGRIGMHHSYTLGFAGTIYEAWYSTTTPTDALFSDIVASVILAP